MKSLRARIVVLGALMALGSALICAFAGVHVAQRNIATMEDRHAEAALAAVQQRLGNLLESLAFEADDYGHWDELHAQMPSPEAAWARINLTPGKVRGALTQYFITADHDRVTGRYHDGEVRGPNASPADPAPPENLRSLLGPTVMRSGLGIFAGSPALYAVSPVRRSDRQGEARGYLIALAYLDGALRTRLEGDGWSLRCEAQPGRGVAADAASAGPHVATIRRDRHRLSITTTLTAHDGSLELTLTSSRAASQRIGDDTALAIVLTGLVVALGATLLGTWLGWRWLAPITALATACRDQVDDAPAPLPANSGLLEADVLSENLRQLLQRLRLGQDELAHALDRETTTNAIHRRFLTQLGHEFGQPIRRIIALCDKVERQAGQLSPEEVASARLLGNELEQRFQDILGLVGTTSEPAGGHHPQILAHYLGGLAELMRPQAEQAGMTIHVDAQAEPVPLDPGLLSPVLVNLCANAIKAGRRGGAVRLKATLEVSRAETRWTVSDDGPGLSPALAERIREIFARGEVLPGTPGVGMGLTLAVANVRTLGGTMSLLQQVGDGVTIMVRLPYGNVPPSASASDRIRRRFLGPRT